MTTPLLSAALIVRDEERHLPDCLRSIEGIVDETVIVDTGSTDATRDIARSFGARVYDVPWQNDFAQARNAALERCRGAWILYIDADERARPCSRDQLHRALRKWYRAGYYVRLQPKTRHTMYREMRLFRNHPQIRFEGVMHENIWPGLRRYMRRHGALIGDSALVLAHVGYEADQERKHERNLPLLLKALEADPERIYCWWHLGHVHRGLGRLPEARKAWQRGIALVRAKRWLIDEDSLPFVELIRLGLDDGENVAPLLAEARRLFPKHPHLVWLEALFWLRGGRPKDARGHFEWLLHRGRAAADGKTSCDERLFASWPWAGLATCCFQERRYADSRRYFELAEAYEPDCLEYRVKRQLCERLAAGEPERYSARSASIG
jgi:glycosyltransferase involved in cell wall biosynthesis